MRISRLYIEAGLAAGARVELDERAAGHAVRVLRLRTGDELVLFDGTGMDYPGTLVEARGGRAVAEVGEPRRVDTESPLELALLQGISRGERMDYTLQKAVELGISRIRPVLTERTVVRLGAERMERRMAHWRGVVIAACEQCGRARMPALEPVLPFGEALAQPPAALRLLLDHRATQGFGGLEPPEGAIELLVGPEGGLAPHEQERAHRAGFRALRMGPRVLRTETAALAALALLQGLFGDLRG